MSIRNDADRWGALAVALHWLTAGLILAMVVLGLIMVDLPLGERKFQLYQIHKSIGLTVLAIGAVRPAWRLANPVPRLPETLKPYERGLARVTHWAMYALILAIPLSGWAMASASPLGIPTQWFGLFTVPHFLPADEQLEAALKVVHETLVWALLVLLALHVWAALKHHFVLFDDTLARMVPDLKPRSPRRAGLDPVRS